MNGQVNGTLAAIDVASHDFSVFANSIASFQRPRGKDLQERAGGFFDWQSNRRRQGIWFYSRSLNREPGSATDILSDTGQRYVGINFASQDYLGLAGHPNVVDVAIDALRCFGPHSAGSPTLLGNTALSLQKQLRRSPKPCTLRSQSSATGSRTLTATATRRKRGLS